MLHVTHAGLPLQEGHDVLGGYMSPVNDAYGKPELLPSRHRVSMCQLAAESSAIVMIDAWEAAQPQYQRSLAVLRHVSDSLEVSCACPIPFPWDSHS